MNEKKEQIGNLVKMLENASAEDVQTIYVLALHMIRSDT